MSLHNTIADLLTISKTRRVLSLLWNVAISMCIPNGPCGMESYIPICKVSHVCVCVYMGVALTECCVCKAGQAFRDSQTLCLQIQHVIAMNDI